MIKSCYIHIPFCTNICSYCDFCKFYYQKEMVDSYLIALEKEIEIKYKNEIMDTIYIGGGTPSSLTLPQLEKLFLIVDKILVSDNYEFTIECNVADLTVDKLTFFKKHRVNRLSIGVESFQDKKLTFLERKLPVDTIIRNIKLAKQYFSNINLDLIYAVPGETLEDLKNDLELFLSLDISHISTYSLIIEENTKLKIKNTEAINEELDRKMYELIHDTLTINGYNHYEISNFSKDNNHSKHNLTYWKNHKYYGFGLGASGYIDNIRYTNTRNFKKYLAGNYVQEEEKITLEIDASNYAILGLRTIYGVDNHEFKNKFNQDFIDYFKVHDLLENGIIKKLNNRYYLDNEYWYIQNEILIKFL